MASRAARALLASLFAVSLTAAPACAHAAGHGDWSDDEQPYFYKGYDYGNQSLYNPVYVLANRGFDVLQLRPGDHGVYSHSYLPDFRNVVDNLAHPFRAIEGFGTKEFVTQELLPLSWTNSTMRWAPNYSLHLLGGGQTYSMLREWYQAHEATPVEAAFFSGATVLTSAIINESLENKGVVGINSDCVADIYFFDIGALILFSFQWPRWFFSHVLTIADWSTQPAFTAPHGDLENTDNQYAFRFWLPFEKRIALFGYTGFTSLGGLSVDVGHGYAVTGAFGGRVRAFKNLGGRAIVANYISTAVAGGIFLDRNESLLASVRASGTDENAFDVQVYPNAFFRSDPGIGFFVLFSRDGRYSAGLSFNRGLGLGLGGGNR